MNMHLLYILFQYTSVWLQLLCNHDHFHQRRRSLDFVFGRATNYCFGHGKRRVYAHGIIGVDYLRHTNFVLPYDVLDDFRYALDVA